MISKYLSLFMLFVLTTFSITFANAKPVVGKTYSGSASFYGARHHGNKTASGERFNMYSLTAAHRSLPLGCTIRVTNQDNGKSVILKVNDRGPFHGNRILDVSQGAAKQLGFIKQGLAKINIEVLSLPESKAKVYNGRSTSVNERVNRSNRVTNSERTVASDVKLHRVDFNPNSGIERTTSNNASYVAGTTGFSSLGNFNIPDLNESSTDSISDLLTRLSVK